MTDFLLDEPDAATAAIDRVVGRLSLHRVGVCAGLSCSTFNTTQTPSPLAPSCLDFDEGVEGDLEGSDGEKERWYWDWCRCVGE